MANKKRIHKKKTFSQSKQASWVDEKYLQNALIDTQNYDIKQLFSIKKIYSSLCVHGWLWFDAS